jgi:hypothetical protein
VIKKLKNTRSGPYDCDGHQAPKINIENDLSPFPFQ